MSFFFCLVAYEMSDESHCFCFLFSAVLLCLTQCPDTFLQHLHCQVLWHRNHIHTCNRMYWQKCQLRKKSVRKVCWIFLYEKNPSNLSFILKIIRMIFYPCVADFISKVCSCNSSLSYVKVKFILLPSL